MPGEIRKPLVLIADDERGVRLLVRATIDSDTYEILEVADGEAALRLVRERRPAVVLLDVTMPGLTGLEVARAVRSDRTLASTRIVMLTARSRPDDVSAGYAAGADAYLVKPFSPLELLATVEAALTPGGSDAYEPRLDPSWMIGTSGSSDIGASHSGARPADAASRRRP